MRWAALHHSISGERQPSASELLCDLFFGRIVPFLVLIIGVMAIKVMNNLHIIHNVKVLVSELVNL